MPEIEKTSGDIPKMSSSLGTARGLVRVKVELLGHLRGLAKKKELEVELALPTIEGLIQTLSNTYGEDFNRAVVSSGSEDLQVIILVNGKDIDFLEKTRTLLSNGDSVVITPVVAGG